MAKTKSKRQVGYLLSNGSPLSDAQKTKLKNELHSGAVKVITSMKSKPVAKAKKFVAGAFARAKDNYFGTGKKKA